MELLIMLLIALLLANMLVVISAALIRRPILISPAPERSQSVGCFPMVLSIFAIAIILGLLFS